MPFKLEKFYCARFRAQFFVFLGFILSSSSLHAKVTVKPVEPYQVNDNRIYYASVSSPLFVDEGAGFNNFDFTQTADSGELRNMLKFTVTSDKAFSSLSNVAIKVMAQLSNSETSYKEVPIAFAGVTDCGTQCLSQKVVGDSPNFVAFFAANYVPKETLTLGIYLKDLCAAIETNNSTPALGCTTDVLTPVDSDSITTVKLIFKVGSLKNTTDTTLEFSNESNTEMFDKSDVLSIIVQGGGTTLSCPSVTDIYFPGDGEISLSAGKFSKSASGEFSPVDTAIVVGANGADPVITSSFGSNAIVSRLLIDSGGQYISGFTNTTDGSDNKYNLFMSVRDMAGVIAPFSSSCKLTGVQTSSISGFLQKSNCFIATAAFRDGEAEPVRLLRDFRDQVLSQFSFGRKFIKFYYKNSPPIAQWLVEHPVFRIPVLHALLPLEIYAWLILNPLFQSSIANADEPSAQPFIDSVKGKLEKDQSSREGSSQGYSEKMKQRILEENPELPVESFIEQEQIKLKSEGEERESAIVAVQQGRSELKAKKSGKIRGAFGLKLSTSANRVISGTNGFASQTLNDVYGTAWVPELGFTYEYQPFHWEWFGNFGLVGSTGLSFQSANGKFKNNLAKPAEMGGGSFGTESQTKLTFYTVPLMVGLNFRLNLLRFLRPYVQACPAAIFFMETRSDSHEGNRGYSRGLHLSGGVNILLDWMFPDSAWNMYEELGFHHTYLTLDYSKLSTLAGDVRFSNSSYSAGMTYEF